MPSADRSRISGGSTAIDLTGDGLKLPGIRFGGVSGQNGIAIAAIARNKFFW